MGYVTAIDPFPEVQTKLPCIFVLGARDPEMAEIIDLLDQQQQMYLKLDVNPRTAYTLPAKVLQEIVIRAMAFQHQPVLVECGIGLPHTQFSYEIVIDHHHPSHLEGRYGSPFELSSIGQICSSLQIWPTKRQLIAGSVDHNLAGVYAMDDPSILGFTRQEMIDYRLECLATAPGAGSIDAVKRAIAVAHELINNASIDYIGGQDVAIIPGGPHGQGYDIDYLSIVEAAMMRRIPYIVRTRDAGDARVKVCIGGAWRDTVEAFMEEYAKDLEGIYGVPARGFAGGYIPA